MLFKASFICFVKSAGIKLPQFLKKLPIFSLFGKAACISGYSYSIIVLKIFKNSLDGSPEKACSISVWVDADDTSSAIANTCS